MTVSRPAPGRTRLVVDRRRARLRARARASGAAAEGHVGLTLLEDLVAQAGGHAEVRSSPGRGHHGRAGGAVRVIRVLLADDHGVIRDGLGRLIAALDDVELVGVAADGAEAVERCAELTPDVVLMDLDMPVLDGIEATRRIVADAPGRRRARAHVVLRPPADPGRAGGRRVRLPAQGRRRPRSVAEGIRAAARGESPLDPRAARTMLDARAAPDPLAGLSAARARGARRCSSRACRTS